MCALILIVVGIGILVAFSISPLIGCIVLTLFVVGIILILRFGPEDTSTDPNYVSIYERKRLQREEKERSEKFQRYEIERDRLENLRTEKQYGVNPSNFSNISAPHETYNDFLKSHEWQSKRKEVLGRSKGLCEVCDDGKTRANDVHHVKYPKRWGQEPVTDLLAVCTKHHRILHGNIRTGDDLPF